VFGNVGEYSDEVGPNNYFMPYEVKVTPFNMRGPGLTGVNNSVMSAEASRWHLHCLLYTL